MDISAIRKQLESSFFFFSLYIDNCNKHVSVLNQISWSTFLVRQIHGRQLCSMLTNNGLVLSLNVAFISKRPKTKGFLGLGEVTTDLSRLLRVKLYDLHAPPAVG